MPSSKPPLRSEHSSLIVYCWSASTLRYRTLATMRPKMPETKGLGAKSGSARCSGHYLPGTGFFPRRSSSFRICYETQATCDSCQSLCSLDISTTSSRCTAASQSQRPHGALVKVLTPTTTFECCPGPPGPSPLPPRRRLRGGVCSVSEAHRWPSYRNQLSPSPTFPSSPSARASSSPHRLNQYT